MSVPVSASQTLIEVSNEPLTTKTPSNCRETERERRLKSAFWYNLLIFHHKYISKCQTGGRQMKINRVFNGGKAPNEVSGKLKAP